TIHALTHNLVLIFTYRLALFVTIITSTSFSSLFFFNAPATTEIYTLSLHDALPISLPVGPRFGDVGDLGVDVQLHVAVPGGVLRSEEHTSELQSRGHLVCRLLLEKKKKKNILM